MSLTQNLIRIVRDAGALRFGEFKLKSGRMSPYFFNAAHLYAGEELTHIGKRYADKILELILSQKLNPADVALLGPAYKGISLATTASMGLWHSHAVTLPVVTVRKEIKDHGEGGALVGLPIVGKRVIIVDDVITAGTAIRESSEAIQKCGGILAGVVLIFDRAERGLTNNLSAVQEVEQTYGIPVRSILTFWDIRDYLENESTDATTDEARKMIQGHIEAMDAYREKYMAQ